MPYKDPEQRRAYARRWMQDNRRTYSELTDEQRLKADARSIAHVYLRRGKLVRKDCERCGSPDSQMHHPDYRQPLLIVWLCRVCHLLEHASG